TMRRITARLWRRVTRFWDGLCALWERTQIVEAHSHLVPPFRPKRRRKRTALQPELEPLETRQLLTGNLTRYHLPVPQSEPWAVAPGPNDYVWFLEGNANKIGKVSTATGVVTEYDIPLGYQPLDLVAGPDGNMWFIELAYPQQVSTRICKVT